MEEEFVAHYLLTNLSEVWEAWRKDFRRRDVTCQVIIETEDGRLPDASTTRNYDCMRKGLTRVFKMYGFSVWDDQEIRQIALYKMYDPEQMRTEGKMKAAVRLEERLYYQRRLQAAKREADGKVGDYREPRYRTGPRPENHLIPVDMEFDAPIAETDYLR